jgi:Ca-activated chloride channel family protein
MQNRASLLFFFIWLAAMALSNAVPPARAENSEPNPCTEDAMLVFDASGSMSGPVLPGNGGTVSRIDWAREALAKVLPSATRYHRIGLITYGPGPYSQCNVDLKLKPTPNAAEIIMNIVNTITPAGRTPLTQGVKQAADVLDYTAKPGVIVVLTDGEETCGGSPCEIGKSLHALAKQLTVHVIAYRPGVFSWMGEGAIGEAKCLADETGGLYLTAKTEDDLVQALQKTLDCPMQSALTRVRRAADYELDLKNWLPGPDSNQRPSG